MAAKRKTEQTAAEPTGHVIVRAKTAMDWKSLIEEAARDHWRRLVVRIRVRDWLLAGKPAQLDAAKAMLKARGLEQAIEAVNVDDPVALAKAASIAQDEGLCEFHRRPAPGGAMGLYIPSNNIKAGLKENWSVLGYRVAHRGSRGALAEGVFVVGPQEEDWIYLGPADPDPKVHTAVSHTTGPSGPVSAVKRHEYLERPEITFVIMIARAIMEKLPDEALADVLHHYGEHGLGACRSQGHGRFDILSVEETS